MSEPFEGIFGKNELKVLEFMMPVDDIFEVEELAGYMGFTKVATQRILNKFKKFGIVSVKPLCEGGKPFYRIVSDSPIIAGFEAINSELVEILLGDETLYGKNDYIISKKGSNGSTKCC